jgi:hypothetical protein
VVITLPASGASAVCLSRTSESGATFAIWDALAAGTYYGSTAPSPCPTSPPPGFEAGGW